MLEAAVVYSVRALGEGFPKVPEMSVVFGDVHKGGLFVLWSLCYELFASDLKGFQEDSFNFLEFASPFS